MKKLFLGFAAVAMMASCAKNETIDAGGVKGFDNPKQINFQATTGKTRATTADLDAVKASGLMVYGQKTGASGPEALFASSVDDGYKYSFKNGAWGWELEASDKDWPDEKATDTWPVQFFAHNFPQTISTSDLVSGYEYFIDSNIADQKDLLGAQTDPLIAPPATGAVTLKMKHLLSKISFAIQTTAGYKVNIQSAKIYNVLDNNKFLFGTMAWQTKTWSMVLAKSFSYFASAADGDQVAIAVPGSATGNDLIVGFEGGVKSGDGKGSLMLVPQTAPAMKVDDFKAAGDAWAVATPQGTWPTTEATTALETGAYIELTYNMQDADGNDIIGWIKGSKANGKNSAKKVDDNKNYYVSVVYPLDLTTTPWVMGKAYTYTISLGTADSSNGTVSNPDFTGDDGVVDPNAPVDNPAVKPGTPITSKKIAFTVSVEDWDETSTSIK